MGGTGSGSESDSTDNDEVNESRSNRRAPSLSEHERSILFGLVAKYKLIVESKHNTAQWIAKKQSTWNTISTEFLAKPGTSNRTAKQLKKSYENYKRIKKRNEITPLRTKDTGVQELSKRIHGRSIGKVKSARPARSYSDSSQSNSNGTTGYSDSNCHQSLMDTELKSKKIKLVNLQIEHEEMKMRFLQEEHDLKMLLLQKQYSAKSNEALLLSDDIDIKSIIL